MKKLVYLLLCIPILFITSCSEGDDPIDEIAELKKAKVAEVAETMLSDMGIPGEIIPGDNNGGNRTCEEVADYYGTTFDLSWDKVDYDGDFMGSFPDGLIVTTDGTEVAFSMDHSLYIDGECYRVGAVIVKGSNAANVYYYENGATSDSGLTSPVNRSGKPAGLSNLTFCFVKCECEGIAIKVRYYPEGMENVRYHAYSNGERLFYMSDWCYRLGFNTTYLSETINLSGKWGEPGFVNVNMDNGGYIIDVQLNEGLVFEWVSVYIGSKQYLIESAGEYCPDYEMDPWVKLWDSYSYIEK